MGVKKIFGGSKKRTREQFEAGHGIQSGAMQDSTTITE